MLKKLGAGLALGPPLYAIARSTGATSQSSDAQFKAPREDGSWIRVVLDCGKRTKTMKTFHSSWSGHRPATSILAQRMVFLLLFLGAGLVLIRPCAGQGGTWSATGSLATARYNHTATMASRVIEWPAIA